MIGTVAESFWVWCYFNRIATIFENAFSYFSVLWRSCRISEIYEVSFWGKEMKRITWRSSSHKTNTWDIDGNVVQSFWVSCRLNSTATFFEATLSYFSVIELLCNFCHFWIFAVGIVLKTKTEKSSKIFVFGFMKLKYIWICFLSTVSFFEWWNWNKQKWTEFSKYRGVKSYHKRNTRYMISKVTESFWSHWSTTATVLKLHSHSSISWHFCWISVISEALFLDSFCFL